MQNQSEVQRLLAQIDREYEAAQNGLSGLAQGTAQHNFINARLENMEYARQELEKLVGPKKAVELVVERMNKQADKRQGSNKQKGKKLLRNKPRGRKQLRKKQKGKKQGR